MLLLGRLQRVEAGRGDGLGHQSGDLIKLEREVRLDDQHQLSGFDGKALEYDRLAGRGRHQDQDVAPVDQSVECLFLKGAQRINVQCGADFFVHVDSFFIYNRKKQDIKNPPHSGTTKQGRLRRHAGGF